MLDPRMIKQVADMLEQSPDSPIDVSAMPADKQDEMMAALQQEVSDRQSKRKAQASVDEDLTSNIHEDAARAAEKANEAPIGDRIGAGFWTAMDPKNPSMAGSALMSAGQGATLGHVDEIKGLLDALSGGDYGQGRDEARQIQHSGEKNFPLASGIANVAGSMLLPGLKGLGSGASLVEKALRGIATGMTYGSVAGEGYSDRPIGDPNLEQDSELGSLMGGGLGGMFAAAGHGVHALASKMMPGGLGNGRTIFDPALLRYLGMDAETIAKLRARDLMPVEPGQPSASEVAASARSASQFPHLDPQASMENITTPANVTGAMKSSSIPGPTAENLPIGPSPGNFAQKTPDGALEQAYREAYLPSQSMEVTSQPNPVAAPMMSPADEMAANGFASAANRPSQGMQPSTMMGGAAQMFQKNITGPTAIGVPKIAQYLATKNFGGGGPGGNKALGSMINRIAQHILQSPDPSFSDYLAKETFPEWLAASKQAEEEQKDENKEDPFPYPGKKKDAVPAGQVLH